MTLPCRDQDKCWTDKQKKHHQYLTDSADEVISLTEKFYAGCIKKRNFYMVDRSAYCICALIKQMSVTGQTVRYAQKQKLCVINVTT